MSVPKNSAWQIVELDALHIQARLPDKGTLIIGASAQRADFTLEGQGVEAAHCAIGCVKRGGWAIKDLGSEHGTFVNGKRVQSKRLALGDLIVIGSQRLEVQEVGQAPKQQAAEIIELSVAVQQPSAPSGAPQGVRRLGGYRIESTLGKGGMGEVVLALQESLERHVAIKLLSTKLASDREFVQAFHSEARSAAALNHPNVVVVHDVGEESGQHYLAMEYMPGGSLEERVLKLGRLPWREVLNILHDAAAGLAYAESQGIVHRDIKPANLMLAASGAIKIADLGLALHVEDQGAGDSAEGRKTYGTPHFISPEQARGLAVDQRSDLYSLGATAYRLLSGRTPFEGENAREIVRARFVSNPKPLAAMQLGMPAGLEQLVHKLMERDPNMRFDSARALLSEVDLLRLRADHGPSIQEQEAAHESAQPKSRWLPIAIAGLAILAVASFFLLGGADQAEQATDASLKGAALDKPSSADRGNRMGSQDPEAFFGSDSQAPSPAKTTDADEIELLRLERAALAELNRIHPDLSIADRIAELHALAQRYAGTDSATQAQAEARRLGRNKLGIEQRSADRSTLVSQTLAALRTHIGWPQPDTNPSGIQVLMERLTAYLPPSELVEDAVYRAGVIALRDEIIKHLEETAQDRILRAETLANQGAFEPLRIALEAGQASLWPGAATSGESQNLEDVRQKSLAYQRRLAGLEEAERQFHFDRARADRVQLALCLGPASNLRAELLDLSLSSSLARIEATRAALVTAESRASLEQAAEVIRAAQRGKLLLASTHAAGLWKRMTISVPKTSDRSTAEEALGVDPEGILIADEEGARLITWASFAHSDAALVQLFRSRLTRSWSEQEAADIASLLCLPALVKSMQVAGDGLLTEAQLSLSPRRVAAMLASLDGCIEWIEEHSGQSLQALRQPTASASVAQAPLALYRRVAREREALELLSRALVANQEESISLTISLIETLLENHGQTLLVQMLSSGPN